MNTRAPLRILLADDHLVIRMGLKTILELEDDLRIVGEAQNGEEAVALAGSLKPDVIVMDLMMPKMSGVEATTRICRADPSAHILVLTTYGASEDVGRVLRAGALGVLVKDTSHDDLIAAIRTVANGTRLPASGLAAKPAERKSKLRLTPRHREILAYVARGFTNREISQLTDIGSDCVKAHLRTIFAELGASNRAEAVSIALSEKLLP